MPCRSENAAALLPPPRRRAPERRRRAGTEDGPPWARRGAVRRDCESHRGAQLLAAGDTSLLLGALSLVLAFPALLGLGLGAAAWALASRDLRQMRARVMDPAGLSDTALGRARARAGVALSLYAGVLWGWFLLLVT